MKGLSCVCFCLTKRREAKLFEYQSYAEKILLPSLFVLSENASVMRISRFGKERMPSTGIIMQ